jgi:cysteinyl-tRNA synthetase
MSISNKFKIYNTYKNSLEELDDQYISIYNCGPTVYNHVHIGNVRPLITFDILNRFLRYLGYEVKYVHNLTDIDDKIINKAKEENKTESEISEFYIDAYKKIITDLNVIGIDHMPKVSENIKEIIQYVDKLINKKAAYISEGDVYFDLNKYKQDYGMVSNQKIEDLLEGVRKENANNKINALDFVL